MAKQEKSTLVLWREQGPQYGDAAIVHADSGDGTDYTFCGAATEGENGDEPMDRKTWGRVNCDRCVAMIRFAKSIPAARMQK